MLDPADRPSARSLARLVRPRAVRVGAVVLAVAVALAVAGGVIRYVEAGGIEPISTANVDRLAAVWTTRTDAGPLNGAVAPDRTLFVSSDNGLYGFPAPCAAEGGSCAPMWHDVVPGGPLSMPVAGSDAVYATSADGLVYAFPASCSAADCSPLWNGDGGSAPVSVPGANDDFVYVASDRLYAFPSHCGTDDLACTPSWTGAVPGHASPDPPAVGGGLVVVASASADGGVVAYPAVCVDRCSPIWSAATHGPASGVALSASTAYVVARDRLFAFPMSCSGTCKAAWSGALTNPAAAPPPPVAEPGADSAPAVEGAQVYVPGVDGVLTVFGSSCAHATCPPQRRYALGDRPLTTPVIRNGVVFVTSVGGVMSAIADGCDTGPSDCAGPWSQGVGAATSGPPAATDDGVYVGDADGTVHAFAVSH